MGFASGFRTGLATGDVRRSAMPIVQTLGSMIDRLAARNKKGSVRFASGDSGPSSYDKYTARKDQEEAAAEEKRRYDTEQAQLKQREQQETDQAAVQAEREAAGEERAVEMHQAEMKSIQAERDEAAKLFERSEKKEKRIEAYRGFIQGIQSRNKALTEQAWATLAPDMPEKEAKEFAPYKKEMIPDPADPTGETMVAKYTVGRDKDGNESESAMPAPSVDYLDDGSIQVQYPGDEQPQIYADAKEFAEQIGYHLDPEFETGEASAKKRKGKKEEQRKSEKHQLALIKAEQSRIDKERSNETTDPDILDKRQAKLDARREKITGGVEGKGAEEVKTATITTPGGKEMLAYAGDKKPPNAPENTKRDENDAWYSTDKDGKRQYWKPPTN